MKDTDIKIAYICLCHTDPTFIGRLAKTLAYRDDRIFVHVDNKVNIFPFLKACSGCENVHFVENRVDNYWGGFNSVSATVTALKSAVVDNNFDRFVLLQGQDYPLISPAGIHAFFLEHPKTEFCHAKDITVSKKIKDYMGCYGFWLHDYNRKKHPLLYCFAGALHRFNKLGVRYRKGIFRHGDEKWHIYKGWAQWSLTRECVEYLLHCYEQMPEYNRYMRYSFPPDELYFHTLIHNSTFRDALWDVQIYYRPEYRNGEESLLNLTYFEYPALVTVFKEDSDYAWLKDTGCLFVRKVNSSSSALLDEIDRQISAMDSSN